MKMFTKGATVYFKSWLETMVLNRPLTPDEERGLWLRLDLWLFRQCMSDIDGVAEMMRSERQLTAMHRELDDPPYPPIATL